MDQKFKRTLSRYNQSLRYLHSGWVNAYTRRNSSRHELLKYPAIVFFSTSVYFPFMEKHYNNGNVSAQFNQNVEEQVVCCSIFMLCKLRETKANSFLVSSLAWISVACVQQACDLSLMERPLIDI